MIGVRGGVSVKVMVFNATFNNISIILWRSVLLEKETGVPRGNFRPAASHWQTWSHNVVASTPHYEQDWKLEFTTLMLIGTDWTGKLPYDNDNDSPLEHWNTLGIRLSRTLYSYLECDWICISLLLCLLPNNIL
jgi:hypothetical protein